MGSNWKEYLCEAKRVLNYNGELIVCESKDRYEKIKEYINEIGFNIIKDEYSETKRWFYIHAINE
jgi:ubiquinone/menaquinone biosynthesis C-methylase UbiE